MVGLIPAFEVDGVLVTLCFQHANDFCVVRRRQVEVGNGHIDVSQPLHAHKTSAPSLGSPHRGLPRGDRRRKLSRM